MTNIAVLLLRGQAPVRLRKRGTVKILLLRGTRLYSFRILPCKPVFDLLPQNHFTNSQFTTPGVNMFTISLLGQKGGTGKTTISVGLSVAAALAGHPVAIIDPQATATKWRPEIGRRPCRSRGTGQPPTADSSNGGSQRRGVCDHRSAGRSDDSALAAARCADLVLIPTRISIVEPETLPQVRDLLRLAHTKFAKVVLNGIHPNAGACAGSGEIHENFLPRGCA